jgi:hypothetical protein
MRRLNLPGLRLRRQRRRGAVTRRWRVRRGRAARRAGREPATMAATNKCLAQSNKSPHRANATKKRTRRPYMIGVDGIAIERKLKWKSS